MKPCSKLLVTVTKINYKEQNSVYLFRRIKLVVEEMLTLNSLRMGESRILISFGSKKGEAYKHSKAQ